jgi:dephospho-CoA kinase
MPHIIGITGGAGMGKSTYARACAAKRKAALFDADAAAHRLLASNASVKRKVLHAFGTIERPALALILRAAAQRRRLEHIFHPPLRREAERFIRRARLARIPLVVLDVPLLFEAGWHNLAHSTLTVSCSPWLQQTRLRKRGWSQQRITSIRRAQWPDARRRSQANKVVFTGNAPLFSLSLAGLVQ